MARLRLLLACLVMLAIPLQGLAAATMLFCGSGATHHVLQAAEDPHDAAVQHDHATHHHGQAAQVDSGTHAPQAEASKADIPVDSAHKCGVCSACCHPAAAIFDTDQWSALLPIPQAEPVQRVAAVHSRPGHVPDKPPRA